MPNNQQELLNIINAAIEDGHDEATIADMIQAHETKVSTTDVAKPIVPTILPSEINFPLNEEPVKRDYVYGDSSDDDDKWFKDFMNFKNNFEKQAKEKEDYEGTSVQGSDTKIDLSHLKNPPSSVSQHVVDGVKFDDVWVDENGNQMTFKLPEVPIYDSKKKEEKDLEKTVGDIKFENFMETIEKDFVEREKNRYKDTDLQGFKYDPTSNLTLEMQQNNFLHNKGKESVDIMPYVHKKAPGDESTSVVTDIGLSIGGLIGGIFDGDEWEEINNNFLLWKHHNLPLQLEAQFKEIQMWGGEFMHGFVSGKDNKVMDMTVAHYNGGNVGWLDPEGNFHDQVNITKNPLVKPTYDMDPMGWRENLRKQGWEYVYEKDHKPVGWAYEAWLANKVVDILETKAKQIQSNVGVVKGLKEGDLSDLLGGAGNAISGALQTVIPALMSKGITLFPQILGPMFFEYNLEKAKAKYPHLEPEVALQKLIDEDDLDKMVPTVLGMVAVMLEKIGIKGISNYIFSMKRSAMNNMVKLLFVGSNEGLTEWGQLGTDVMNREIPKLREMYPNASDAEINAAAAAIALEAMCSEEGLERFLMGMIGGGFIAGSGAGIRRALNRDKSSVVFFSDKINEIANLRKEITENPTNETLIKQNEKKIAKIEKEIKDFANKNAKLENYLTEDEKFLLLNLIDTKDSVIRERNEALRGKDMNDPANKIIKKRYDEQIESIEQQVADIKNAANERLLDQDIESAKKNIEGKEDVDLYIFSNESQLKGYLTQEGLEGTKEGNNITKGDGTFRKGKDGKLHVIVNKPVAINVGAVSAATHEVLHYLVNGYLHDEDGNLTNEAEAMLDDFIKSLPRKARLIVEARIEESYGDIKQARNRNLKEEYLNLYVDAVLKGQIKPHVGILRKWGSIFKKPMKDAGYENIDFQNASEVLTFLNGLIKANQNDKAGPNVKVEKSGNTVRQKMSNSADIEPQVKKLGDTTKAKWDAGGADQAFSYMYGLLDGFIISKITPEMEELPGWNQEDFVSSCYEEILRHIRNFDPSQNDNLYGWVVSQIGNKVKEVLKTDKAGTTEKHTQSIEDEGSFVNDLESDTFVDVEMEMENDITFTQLRKILNIPRNGPLHNKIKRGIKIIIPVELSNLYTKAEKFKLNNLKSTASRLANQIESVKDIKLKEKLSKQLGKVQEDINELIETANTRILEEDTFKKKVLDYFKANHFDDIKKLIGTPGSKQYKDFITNNAELLYNLFPQQVFNKQFQDFIVKGKRLTVPETREAQENGLLPKDLTEKQMADGIYLYTKLPWNSEVEQMWINNFLNPQKGRPASKQNSLIDLFSWFLGSDAMMEVVNSTEFMKNNDIDYSTVVTIATKIDRGVNVKFSNTSGGTSTINRNKISGDAFQAQFMQARGFLLQEGITDIPAKITIGKLKAEFPTMNNEVIEIIAKMYDKQQLMDASSLRFKQLVNKNPHIPKEVKEEINTTLRYDEKAKKKLLKNVIRVAQQLPVEVLDILGYDFLGFINRALDAAKKKEDGTEGPYYQDLLKLKEKVKNTKGKKPLPEDLVLDDIRLMNKKFKLFKDIDAIVNNGDSKIDGSNLKWKLFELSKMAGEIKRAGEANLKLAKYLAKTFITARMDQASFINLMQLQTNAVAGFRALTSLDLISVLEGPQGVSEAHPYFQEQYEIAKNAVHKTNNKKKGIKKGDKKFTTHEAIVAEALYRLSKKGEHAEANANTMAALVDLDARYRLDPTIDLDAELDIIFLGHGQIHGEKGTFDIIDDKGGTTNTENWLRVQLTDRNKDLYSPDGKQGEEVVAEKERNRRLQLETQKIKTKNSRTQRWNRAKKIALQNMNNPQGGSFFDFDWTVGVSDNYIYARKDGRELKISSYEYPTLEAKLRKDGWELDFSDFNNVSNGRPGPLLDKMRNQVEKFGPEHVYILTARPHEAKKAIQDWLASEGIIIPLKNIITLANGSPEAKADAIVVKVEEGYNDIYFVDDHLGNVDAVQEVIDEMDIKGKSIQSRIKEAKEADELMRKTFADIAQVETHGKKVIFLVGGAGSGKSTITGKLALGYKIINPDDIMEPILNELDVPLDQSTHTKEQASLWGKVQAMVNKEIKDMITEAMATGENIIIDGTGASKKKMEELHGLFTQLGWDVGGLHVDTSVEVAKERNSKRDRKLRDVIVERNHEMVRKQIPIYQKLFGPNFFQINTDNLKLTDGLPAEFTEKISNFTNVNTKYSKSDQFNKILQETEGIPSKATVSATQAKVQSGRRIGMIDKVWGFIFPPSAYDLEMFIYRMLAKGKLGEKQKEWFKKNLFDPFTKAFNEIARTEQRIRADYRDLVKKMPEVRKMLKTKIPGSNLTYDHAIRVYLWNKMGIDMVKDHGMTKRDFKACIDAVDADSNLKTFAGRLSAISGENIYVPPSDYWSIENIAYDLKSMGDVSRAEHLAEWVKNKNEIFSEENINKLRLLYGDNFIEALDDMLYRMEYGKSRNAPSRIETQWANWVNNSVGAIMFFNMRSAVLQTISAINFVNWSDNNPAKAALAFANVPQFVKDFTYIFNSDYLKTRRGKNARTLNENEISELTSRMKNSTNKAQAALAYLLEIGFAPTRIADSFAISSGGATFYRNRIKTYEKQGLSTKDAEAKAWQDFVELSEKAQQSSRPDLISQQQAGGLGRLILAFKNTPMQYNRIMIKAVLDLKNNRGKTHENLSKIAYYGMVQNIIFTSLQTALWSAFGDEEEWDAKTHRLANNMIDNILNGLGLTGSIVVTMKNSYLRYQREKEKGWGADHTRTIIEFANLSPTIGSKLRKLYGAIRTEQLNEEAIQKMGWTIDNPAFNSIANLISAVTNVPLDRAVQKTQNLLLACDSETEFYDKLALTLGWNPWDLGMESTSKKAQKQIEKKEAEEKAAKQKRCKGKSKSTKKQCGNVGEYANGYCPWHQDQVPKK